MKFFNADGSINRENGDPEVFGWIWQDLNEDKDIKMTIYNADGSVRSTEYYDERQDWEVVAKEDVENQISEENDKESVNTMKWYQRTTSNIEENNKTRLFDLLMNLNNRESNLLLPIVDGARFLSLTKTAEPEQAETTINHSHTLDINDGISRMLRLKRLYEIFEVSSKVETFKKPYEFFDEADSVYEVNKCIDYYLEEVTGLKEILFRDGFPPAPRRTEVDTGPNGIEIERGRELFDDIDQTLLKLFDKTCELHCEVEKIRKCFLVNS